MRWVFEKLQASSNVGAMTGRARVPWKTRYEVPASAGGGTSVKDRKAHEGGRDRSAQAQEGRGGGHAIHG